MATTTPALTLRKELGTETYDVDVTLNGNWDKIDNAFDDSALATAGAQVAMLRETAVTPTYTGSTAASTINLQPTWNTTGIMRGLFIQVTHTAAHTSSRVIEVKRGSTTLFEVDISTTSNSVNGVKIEANSTGLTPGVSAIGTDTNINLGIIPKGTGRVLAGTNSGGGLSVTGNLTVTQSASLTDPLASISTTSTWNDAADTMVGWRLSVTDTASAAGSMLLDLQVGGAPKFRVAKGGTVYINDDANAGMTVGLTINQGAADDDILTLKSSDVAHGMTTWVETDTFARFKKFDSAGGLHAEGYKTGSTPAVLLHGVSDTDDTTKTTAGTAYVEVRASKKSGTTITQPGVNANLFAVRNGSDFVTQFIVDEEGELHARSGTVSTFDSWDDAHLIRAWEVERSPAGVIRDEFDSWLRYGREDLERAGIAHWDERGGVMVNLTQLQRLHSGALWQLHKRLQAMADVLGVTDQVEARLALPAPAGR